jgi:phospholipid/cholesterol/gamma-HCH transport system ATP-binding protein
MIQLKGIEKSFGGNKVLKGISCTFEEGKVNFIIGKSGEGKTVLNKCMVGLVEVDEGHIFYGNEDFTSMDRWERKKVRTNIGMLFQGAALFDSMNVEQNIQFPMIMFTKLTRGERDKKTEEILEQVGLQGKNKMYPSELSGGMKKRTGLARAIALNPKYLFVDEPNSGLDPVTSIMIDKLVQQLTKQYNMTTVVISHDMNSVIEIADTIHFISKGEFVWEGDRNSILSATHPMLNDFVFASQFMKEIKDKFK